MTKWIPYTPIMLQREIRKIIAGATSEDFARGCEIWKGWGQTTETPFGWWVRPANGAPRWIGEHIEAIETSVIKELYEGG
jgi:hypothetical protein